MKHISNEDFGAARWKTQDGHKKKEVRVSNARGEKVFVVFWRQNSRNQLDFTVGLAYEVPGSNARINLIRCNGNSHFHEDAISGQKINFDFHIHRAREECVQLGSEPECFAQSTNKYNNIDDGFAFLCVLSNITIGSVHQTRLGD